MTMEEVIEKAIEGGWNVYEDVHVHPDGDIYLSVKGVDELEYVGNVIFLDPLFWQSLGKAMGWDRKMKRELANKRIEHYYKEPLNAWIGHWHDFIDHLAEGGTPESFFATLK